MGTYHIDLETSSGLNLAYQGENKAHKVIVHYGKWAEEYGEGTLGIMIQRPGDEAPYLAGAVVVGANHTVEWTILAQDLAFRGYGKVQFRYTVDDVIVKSKLFDFKVERSLDDLVNPPSVWQSYIDIVASDRARAETAAGKAEEATVHAPIPGNNGNWYIWDQDAEDYLDSGEPAVITPIFLDELPEIGQFGFLYMIPSDDPDEDNLWDEYLWTGTAFERIGSATIDLSNYVQKLSSSTTGDVLTASADGGIADGGIALTEIATLSALSQALETKVDTATYTADMGRLFPPVKQKGDSTISATDSDVSYLGNYRIDADGGLIEAGNYKAYQYQFTEKGTIHFNSFGNNSYAMVGIYSGNPSAATFIPPRKNGSTPADIGTISVQSGNIIVFTGIPQSSAVEFSFIFTHEIDKPSSVPIISSIQKVYVATNGNDSNDGTKDHPFATVEKAISVSQNVVLKSGVYTESVSIKDKYNISICADTERADSDEVVFDYAGKSTAIFECENVIGLHIADIEIKNASGNGCNIHKCANVNLDSCRFYYNGAEGLSLDNSNANVTNCTADYNGNDGFNIHGHGNTNFYNCVAHHNGRVNPDSGDGLSHHDSCTGYIAGGYFYDNAKGGISSPTYGAVVNISNAFVYGNRFGMQIYGGDSMVENSTTVKIDNCVFKSNTVGIQVNKYAVDLVNCVFSDNGENKLIESGTVTEY